MGWELPCEVCSGVSQEWHFKEFDASADPEKHQQFVGRHVKDLDRLQAILDGMTHVREGEIATIKLEVTYKEPVPEFDEDDDGNDNDIRPRHELPSRPIKGIEPILTCTDSPPR